MRNRMKSKTGAVDNGLGRSDFRRRKQIVGLRQLERNCLAYSLDEVCARE